MTPDASQLSILDYGMAGAAMFLAFVLARIVGDLVKQRMNGGKQVVCLSSEERKALFDTDLNVKQNNRQQELQALALRDMAKTLQAIDKNQALLTQGIQNAVCPMRKENPNL